SLKVLAGDPSYDAITTRINVTWSADGRPAGELARRGTVADCFKLGRRRLNADLVIAVVRVLHPDDGYVAQWRQALRVVGEKAQAAAQVRAQDTLPDDLVEAIEFLKRAAPDVAVGDDPYALERITRRCGYLPLALG